MAGDTKSAQDLHRGRRKKARRVKPPGGDVAGGGYQVGRQAPVRRVRQPKGDVQTGGGYEVGRQAPRPAPQRAPQVRDVKSDRDRGRAESYKRTAAYRKDVRAAYDAAPPKERRRILKKSRGVEHETVLKVHRDRMRRRREVERSQARHDVVRDRDLRAADEFKKTDRPYREAIVSERRKRAKRESSGLDIDVGGILEDVGRAAGETVTRHVPGAGLLVGKNAPKPLKTLAKRSARDLRSFPVQAVTGSYYTGRAAVKAAKGDTREAKKLLRDFEDTSVAYNLAAAGVEAAKGDFKDAGEHVKKAGKSAYAHPGFAALEVGGTAGTAGRVAGTAGRTAGKVARKTGQKAKVRPVERAGAAVQRYASTEREPARVPGTALEEKRTYSKSLPVKRAQVLREKRRVKTAENLRTEANRVAKSDPESAAELRAQADKADPRVMTETAIRKRVDEEVALSEGIRRSRRAHVQKSARKVAKRSDSPLVSLRAQGIVRSDPDDVRAYIRELEGEAKGLAGSRLKANRKLRASLEAELKGRRVMKVGPRRTFKAEKVEQAAAQYRGLVKPMQEELVRKGVISRAESEAALTPYAVRRMGMKHEPAHWVDADGKRVSESEVRSVRANDPTTAKRLYTKVPDRFVDRRGREVTPERIRAHMREHGEPEPAFVSQAPDRRGAFYVPPTRPASVPRQRRTGEAVRKGVLSADPDVLVETAVRSRGLGDAQSGFSRFVGEFSYRGKSGKPRAFTSRRQAENAARDAEAETGVRVRPVRINAFLGREGQLRALMDETDPETFEGHPKVKEALESAIRGDDGQGPWTLVPEAAARQLQEHVSQLGGGAGKRAVQALNQTFRRAVLATSPNWAMGNVSEATFRAGLNRAGPRSYVTGRSTMKRLAKRDPQAAEELAHRAISGGHFSAAEHQVLKRSAEQFTGSRLETPAKFLQGFLSVPGPKQLRGLWHGWTRMVFHHVNGTMERAVQTAMLGKAVRTELLDDKLLKLSGRAMDEAAEGLTNTATQAQMARAVRRAYGRYNDYSPTQRAALTLYSPFGAWFANSVYFVTRTLPVDHPTVTALIADMEQLSEEWREEYGLDLYAKGSVPGFLQGSIPLSGGRFQRAPMKHLPFAAWQDPLGSGADLILPQVSSTMNAMKGKDWRGETIWKEDKSLGKTKAGTYRKRRLNEGERAVEAMKAFAESTVPILSRVDTGVAGLNPYKPTQPPKKKAKRARKTKASPYAPGTSGDFGSVGTGSFGAGGFTP